ncbi:MAG: helix-turn-helix transcriptional regulator [Coriobacteriales bacterium]|jgi:putative transcriptional regulator|nr:helix-turn-helix transcriptional regulator [Coriobacteriales bacterium]
MPIIIRLDRMLVERKMSQVDLADKIDIAPMNLSRIKTGKIRAIRLSTLERLCEELRCQPGDLLEYMTSEEAAELGFDVE